MAEHMDRYYKFKRVKVEIPNKGKNIINFTNYNLKLEAPFCIYTDFESVMERIQKRRPFINVLIFFCGGVSL